MCDCEICTGKIDIGSCPICDYPMDIDPTTGIKYCVNPNTESKYKFHVYILCICGRRMLPTSTYLSKEGTWKFWRCPHCFKRW